LPFASHRPRKRFGQHFLHDRRILERIVEAIDPQRRDAIVEIGPGEGALTRLLLERVERLAVHCADALRFDFSACPAGARLVGNLPYNISTPLLFHLGGYADRVRDMHFMLQLEVVERMVAEPSTPAYGRLSVMLQTRFRMHKLFRVPAGAFRPPPKVESALVRLVPLAERPNMDETAFANVVAAAFSARRKTLRNALPLAAADFEALAIDPGLRPENLGPADYVRIAQRIAR
jgi:16S rRNA (adenine1518-N6/adenine1519-N6)-dimethyltransferase